MSFLDNLITRNAQIQAAAYRYNVEPKYLSEAETDGLIATFKKIDNPDIIALSNFVWNTQLNHTLAKEIKKRYPKCKVIFGGLGNPNKNRLDNFFEEHEYIDMIVNVFFFVTFIITS